MKRNTAQLLELAKTIKLKELAKKRYEVEISGLTLPDSSEISTTRESQTMIANAYASLKDGLIPDTQYKSNNGWTTITLTEITPIATAVAAHVRDVFANEKIHTDAIAALTTMTDLDNYDITTGW